MSTNLKRPLRVLFTNYFPYSNNLCPKLKFPLLQPNKDCPLPGIVSEVMGYCRLFSKSSFTDCWNTRKRVELRSDTYNN